MEMISSVIPLAVVQYVREVLRLSGESLDSPRLKDALEHSDLLRLVLPAQTPEEAAHAVQLGRMLEALPPGLVEKTIAVLQRAADEHGQSGKVQPIAPVQVFFSYPHEDEDLMHAVRRQLVVFEDVGRIEKWHDRAIPPGTEWEPAIDERLIRAKVILLFVSPAFIDSKYCYEVELTTALDRHVRGEAVVIPIITRPCAWQAAPFGRLQALPQDGRAITTWANQDEATLAVALGVMRVVDGLVLPGGPIGGDDLSC